MSRLKLHLQLVNLWFLPVGITGIRGGGKQKITGVGMEISKYLLSNFMIQFSIFINFKFNSKLSIFNVSKILVSNLIFHLPFLFVSILMDRNTFLLWKLEKRTHEMPELK